MIRLSGAEKVDYSGLKSNDRGHLRLVSRLIRLTRGSGFILPVLLPFLILVSTGLYGLNYGRHWGEDLALKLVDRSIQTGILLPDGFYQYPSMTYWLSFVSLGSLVIPILQNEDYASNLVRVRVVNNKMLEVRERLREVVQSQAYKLRTRGVFLVVSALAVVWVYLLQLAWGRSWIEALLAALILGLSWEIAYHARWIAPDAVLMQFGALTSLFVVLAWTRPRGWIWIRLAAIAAGLAVGTKYPAGLLLLPVLFVAYLSWDRISVCRGLIPLLLETLIIFGFSYLVTTPGTLLDPVRFIQDIYFEINHYRTEGLAGHTVSPGVQHLSLNLTYFALSLFSRFDLIAVAFSALSLLGIYAMFRVSGRAALLFLSFPVSYVLFMSTQSVMVPRNLQIVAPFLAILTAWGIALLWKCLQSKFLRIGLVGLVATSLIINAIWLGYAAQTIRNQDSDHFIREAAAYIKNHPESRFFVSDKVWSALASLGETDYPNITRRPLESVNKVLFYPSDGSHPLDRPATRRDLTITWFGPYEVNMNYYPNWAGGDRIFLTFVEQAQELGITVGKIVIPY